MDLGCPHCAQTWQRVAALDLRIAFRHFPVASKHPRAPALHAAAEAAGLQGAFFEMCDSLYADPRHDDPHLWERVRALGLELDRFEADRRSDAVVSRVRRDFTDGIRAGIVATPAAFVDGQLLSGEIARALGAGG